MKRVLRFAAFAIALGLSACATQYGSQDLTGGYDERELGPGIWSLLFAGNGYTTAETVQTFWLYRAAELTLQHGYAGFEIISDMSLISGDARADGARLYDISDRATFVPETLPPEGKPYLRGHIRMLKAPVFANPPRIFDAAALKAALEPLVKGPLCGGNVCPHVHSYLRPSLRS